MRTILAILFTLVSSVFLTNSATAHPGRTASDGCHYCRTNCQKWGELEGERHCHGNSRSSPGARTRKTPSTDESREILPFSSVKLIRVIDGDTVEVRPANGATTSALRVRLANIDAPELDQPGGQDAKLHLVKLLKYEGKELMMRQSTTDRYGRAIARLYVDDTAISRSMVKSGWAWVYSKYNTDGQLPKLQLSAQRQGIGIWAPGNTRPLPPWEWRSR